MDLIRFSLVSDSVSSSILPFRRTGTYFSMTDTALSRRRFLQFAEATRRNDHVGARIGESERGGSTDAAPGTGDDGNRGCQGA